MQHTNSRPGALTLKKILLLLLLSFLALSHACFAAQADQKIRPLRNEAIQSPSEKIEKREHHYLTIARLQQSRELEHKRTAHSRLYENPDQTYTTVYSSDPLHYKAEDGTWKVLINSNHQKNEFETTEEEDFTQIGSCFFPQYNISSITLPVPEGHTILNTHLEWEFVSHNQAWKSEQRSYISGPSGQTQVFQGTGNTEGMQSYSTNSGLANGISTGEVTLTFHAARTWGGSGCNTQYSYINRRYIQVIHGDIEFGDGEVVINEYSASNRHMTDDFGNYEDWVKLYNPSGNFVDLTGYYLSDNPNNPEKWQFPGGILPPGGHLLVICSGRDAMSGSTPHTNFRLSQLKPESILLSDPQGNLLESYELFVTQNGHSYGRKTSGSEKWGVFENPTPGSFNMGAKDDYAVMPEFSAEAGFYNAPVMLTITTAEPNAAIRFTTDGSEPTAVSSQYSQPIVMDETTVVRARTYSNDENILPGFIETSTYFINESHVLPVFSFSGDELFILFGGSQIETIGAYEFFDENGVFIDKSVGDFDKHGNDSWSYPQRGVDFVSRDEYGYNAELNHKFFATSERTGFQRLMVKAAANDNYPFEEGGAHIRDSYIQSLSQLIGLDMDVRSSTNVILYVNGEYWGVYDLREKVDDKDYTDYYYDQPRKYKGSEEYIQFLKTWGGTEAKYGEQKAINDWNHLRTFIAGNHMGDSVNFAYVDSLFNLQSLIDHFVYNSYVVSRDWLNYNTGWWRGMHPEGEAKQWRYILWDTEAALGHFNNYTGIPDITAHALPCNVENINVGNGHAQSLKKLIDQNENFRQQYVTRYIDLLNTWLSCDHAIHVLDSMVAVIEPEMPRQIARWGGNMQTWHENVQEVRDFLLLRCESLVQGLVQCYDLDGPFDVRFYAEPENTGEIKMNSVWIPSYPFDAFIYGNIETKLEASGFGPYVLSHWTINGDSIPPDSLSQAISLNVQQDKNITAHFYNPNLDDKELLYYWHFNELETPDEDVRSIDADFSLMEGTLPLMNYEGFGARDMDAYNTGSALNLHFIEEAGKAARVRNPSLNRSLLFNLPTTDYQDIVFAYATKRSTQGMLNHIISWSADGVNFTEEGLPESVFAIGEEYEMISLDFTDVPAVNNNPDFHIRISFEGNTAQAEGNNRFDNITLKGNPYTEVPVSVLLTDVPSARVYPNPFSNELTIEAQEGITSVRVYDVPGNLLLEKETGETKTFRLNTFEFLPGMYFLEIQTTSGFKKTKVVKQ